MTPPSSPAWPVVPGEQQPPQEAWKLGHAGLIPFALGTLLVWLVGGDSDELRDAHVWVALSLSAYAGAIVAFLGGVHWGLAMRAGLPGGRAFRWAMVPPLVGWFGMIMPPHAGLVVLGVMLGVCYWKDRQLYTAAGLGYWLTLRFRLSAIAAFCCFLGAAGI
ncbi:DUF3429 domain-containing protein [Ideonella sp. TBM-1]|uniref:DUF3429 domain-containing protein n=2 Tax=Ideonella livida TaxID=2707176 RepID=A0A7C9PH15_9BURK|nr:DUF3429 domain-containing protein [Ideonella livida]